MGGAESMGSESLKILHKIILPENVVIFYFSDVDVPLECPKAQTVQKFILPENVFKTIFIEVEMLLKCPKVRVLGQNLQKFCQTRPIKFGKMLQIS